MKREQFLHNLSKAKRQAKATRDYAIVWKDGTMTYRNSTGKIITKTM